MRKRTIRCPECGDESVCEPRLWIDFADWVCGYPRSIACRRCGKQIPLPDIQDAGQETVRVPLAVATVLLVALVVFLAVVVLTFRELLL
jgi:DNA-directed RNA polymerase subunit RPC12/RpoP